MSDPILISYLEGMKKLFWHERRHLQQDEIKLQWAAKAATYTRILHDTEAFAQSPEFTLTQGQQMARQSTFKPSAEAAARRRASGTVTPLELGQRYHNVPSSEPMSRKRARSSQYGPDTTAKNAISARSLDTNPWQRDNNAPYCGYTNISTSGPSFKARRTSTGRMPIKITENSPHVTVYEPDEYLQQSRAFSSSSFSPNGRPQSSFDNDCFPPSSFESPSPFPFSPTTTVSERFTDTTPPTSAAMSRQDSLATSFCGAFGMMRADSGLSTTDSGQNMYRQDSYHGLHSNSFSPDGQGVGAPFDASLYFAHAEGTAIEPSSASTLAVEQLQLPPTLEELDTEMKKDLSSSSIPTTEQSQTPSKLELHTKMVRDASSDSEVSSTSRISRRSQEQIAQAARPIAPKDVAESPTSKHSSSSLSGSQEMLRQRSAPEPKILIPKLQYSRQTKEKLKCEKCNKNPDGYRGSHELYRHMALDHNSSRTAWVCVDISSEGFLSGCTACESKKPYGQDYNAAAHLRRFHFHPKSEVRRTNVDPEEKRGGKGGGKDPPMSECRRWMKKIKVPGKDYTALADSAVNDADADAIEDDEASKEQEEQDEMMKDLFLPENVQRNEETLQPHSSAVGQQISASPLNGANSLELAMTDNRQFMVQNADISFSQPGFQAEFETPFETYCDSNAASFSTSSMNLAYSRPTLTSPAPTPPSFLNSSSTDPAQGHGNIASSTPDSLHLPSTMSTTSVAHSLEDFNPFQTSYIHDNVSYGMSAPNNPQVPYGLTEFPQFR